MKEIYLKYYGQLAEIRGLEKEIIRTERTSLQELLNDLYDQWPQLQHEIFAVFINNKKNTDHAYNLISHDEISLLPPFAGG